MLAARPGRQQEKGEIREKANQGRLKKQLDKLFNFGDELGVMPLGKFLETATVTRRSVEIQRYSSRKIHLNYKELEKPRKHYHVGFKRGNDEIAIEVSKLVWDSLTNLPIKG